MENRVPSVSGFNAVWASYRILKDELYLRFCRFQLCKQRAQKAKNAENLTQSKLAEKLGIDTSSLGKLEFEINFTAAKILLKMSIVFDISPAELFNFGDKIKPDTAYNDKFDKIFELLLVCSKNEPDQVCNISDCVLKFKK